MRTEQEMMDLILETARRDSRVLAAYLKGSRANQNVPKDVYQDFDIMYVVKEVAPFREDTAWLDGFGEVILKQEQDDDFGYGERFGIRGDYDKSYSWLLLFADGNRIDIGVETLETMEQGKNRNRLFVPLLDKIGCLLQFPPTEEEFWVQKPTEKGFMGCCNTFYWNLCDVVKGLARQEMPFAMTTYHGLVWPMLEQMLQWQVGTQTDFRVSCGKLGKYLKNYLPKEQYDLYLETLPDGDFSHFWKAIEKACTLFRQTAEKTAEALGFVFPEKEEKGFRQYADMVKEKMKK